MSMREENENAYEENTISNFYIRYWYILLIVFFYSTAKAFIFIVDLHAAFRRHIFDDSGIQWFINYIMEDYI